MKADNRPGHGTDRRCCHRDVPPLRTALLVLVCSLVLMGCSPFGGSLSPGVFIGADGINRAIGEPLQVEAGEELQLRLARIACCTYTDTVEAPVRWSLEEEGVDAAIDPRSGLLSVGEGVEHGTRVTVKGAMLFGLRPIREQVIVYSRDSNPLIGAWQEQAQLSCDSGTEVPVEMPIKELIISADRSLRVTWNPFESYVDYRAQYTFLDEGRLRLSASYVNYLPQDFDGEGSYRIDEAGRLILEGIWLGRPRNAEAFERHCGHIFVPK